ncbi:MAG: DUF484 family protein [Gammaproteobacteria bacterium]|nr:DUF484 family protein [Gammaproteobacteria bacterium]MDD2929956.1 DUF484 family protein [Sideroxydans sp.]MDD5471883.1 DUF484 family protein [Sideroxydans sp.]
MKSEDVARYLQDHPEFFEQNAEMLAEINLPHPHGGRTISLSERQMLTLREKVKSLEKKLRELLEYAKENDALQLKVHRFNCALFGPHDRDTLQNLVIQSLNEIFAVPHVALHLWKSEPPSSEVLAFADEQALPVCTHHAVADTQSWFGESGGHLRSFAYLPLRVNGQTIGLLVLGSEDKERFYPEMGTVFLQRIAETLGSAFRLHV